MYNSNYRKQKKRIRNKSNALQKKGYFICCNYHPCKATHMYPFFSSTPRTLYDADVDGISLIDEKPSSCSLFYCNPIPITEQEAIEMSEYSKNHTWLEYLEKYIYGQKLSDEQRNVWLNHQKEWIFRTNGNLI